MIAEVKAKKQGKIKGTSDLFIFLPSTLLVIELKRQKKTLKSGKLSKSHSKPSKEQLQFIEDISYFSYVEARVCYGWVEAMNYIEAVQREESLKG